MVRRRQKERGAIAILAALLVMVLGGFLALTLDLGHKYNARAQLQAAGDSAALAAARALDGMTDGLNTAQQVAQGFANDHRIDQSRVTIDPTKDVILGFWDVRKGPKGTFIPDGQQIDDLFGSPFNLDSSKTPQFYNAVKVTTAADGAPGHNDALNVFFGAFVNFSGSLTSRNTVVAVGGGPCDENFNVLPVVVKACSIADGAGSTKCGQTVTLAFGLNKDVAFADLTPPSNTITEDEVNTQISNSGTGRLLEPDAPKNTNAFDQVAISAGTGWTNAIATLTARAPAPFVLPVVNAVGDCDDTMGDGVHATPIGFTNVSLQSVGTAMVGGVSTLTMTVVIDCTRLSSERGGCADFGFQSVFQPNLAQ
jgi:Flp pilus assembly protein TadG